MQIVRVSESQRKFRINTKSKQLVVKCESLNEREEWINMLCGDGSARFN